MDTSLWQNARKPDFAIYVLCTLGIMPKTSVADIFTTRIILECVNQAALTYTQRFE